MIYRNIYLYDLKIFKTNYYENGRFVASVKIDFKTK